MRGTPCVSIFNLNARKKAPYTGTFHAVSTTPLAKIYDLSTWEKPSFILFMLHNFPFLTRNDQSTNSRSTSFTSIRLRQFSSASLSSRSFLDMRQAPWWNILDEEWMGSVLVGFAYTHASDIHGN